MRKTVFMVLSALVFMGRGNLSAQQSQVGLKLEVDQREVAVGDKLNVTIEFKQIGNGGGVVQGPSLPALEHFDRGGTMSATQMNVFNGQTATVSTTKLTLVASKPGEETIGPAVLIYQDPQLGRREVQSNIATVKVTEKTGFSLFKRKKAPPPPPAAATANPPAAPSGPEDELRDLKPLIPESPFSWLFRSILGLAILALVVFLIRRFFFTEKAPDLRTALGDEARLREAWRKLADEGLSGKEFCLALSSLVRECLQYRFGFPAVDYTTEEILGAISGKKMTDDEKVAVEKCLKACDRVLYADGGLSSKENLRGLCSALLPKVAKR